MICEYCGKEHLGTYATGRFCDVKCARAFPTKMQRALINKIVSGKLKGNKNKLGKRRNDKLGGYSLLLPDEIFKKETVSLSNSSLISFINQYSVLIEKCDHDTWNGRPLKRHLHHKNQDRTDARKENLIFLCPNCHQHADEDARKLRK